jgi:hypothetical protein
MNRCLVETDEKTRILLATCIGEVGAIAVDRLEENSDRNSNLKMEHGPWKSRAARHQLKLVTEHLVTSLKAAHTTSDQHKIMFTIQQILQILDRSVSKRKVQDDTSNSGKSEMSGWLSAQLSNSGVLDIVEPFWWTEFCEVSSILSIDKISQNYSHQLPYESPKRLLFGKALPSSKKHHLILSGCLIGAHIWLVERTKKGRLSGVNYSMHVGLPCGLQ